MFYKTAMLKMEKRKIPHDCLLITWLSYYSSSYGSSRRAQTNLLSVVDNVAGINASLYVSGMWAVMVL